MFVTEKIDIDSLINTQLPVLPATAMRVATLVQDMNASTRAVADAIGNDPALAARILRIANSPIYSFERRITAIPAAVTAIGNQAIHMQVMMSATADAFDTEIQKSKVGRTIWEHSLAVGFAAKEVCFELGMRGAEEGFLCGLLHDIGKLILLRYNFELYKQIAEESIERDMLTQEKAYFGYTHDQIGALAARRWGLPEEISHVIFNHHQPSEASQYMLMARVVDVADLIANSKGFGLRCDFQRELLSAESVIALNLSEDQLEKIWEKTVKTLSEVTQMYT